MAIFILHGAARLRTWCLIPEETSMIYQLSGILSVLLSFKLLLKHFNPTILWHDCHSMCCYVHKWWNCFNQSCSWCDSGLHWSNDEFCKCWTALIIKWSLQLLDHQNKRLSDITYLQKNYYLLQYSSWARFSFSLNGNKHLTLLQFHVSFIGNSVIDPSSKHPKVGSEWDLSTGHAFECSDNSSAAEKLLPEREFIKALMQIGKRLVTQPTKDAKTHR